MTCEGEATDRICDCLTKLVEDGYDIMFINELAIALVRRSMEEAIGLEEAVEMDRIFRAKLGWEEEKLLH